MGAACKKSKVKDPKRAAARELEEKERKEREDQKIAEEEAAKAAEDKRLEDEEAAERARLEEEKRRAEEEEEEARRKAEEEEAARLKALEDAEAQRLKDLEEAERKAREEAEAAERAAKEAREAAEADAATPPPSPPSLSVPPEPTQLDQDEMTPHEKYQKLSSDQDIDATSEATLSTQATGAVQRPQESIKETKPSPPPQQVKVTAAPMSARSVTPCDMTAVDQTAKLVSKSCGCDMGDAHDENKCPICKNMDLSDAPLLN